MKAAFRSAYGPYSSLVIKEMEILAPGDNEILIKVFATTVNRTDCAVVTGNPFPIRFFTGLTRPKNPVTGTDFAGVVETVGASVKDYTVGDRVWGFDDNGLGSQAQYFTLPTDKPIRKIPPGISFQQAAASAEGAHYAVNFMNKVQLQAGQQVLVNGATGAIGSALVQFLKYRGLEVTATCRDAHTEQVKALGADHIIDYQRQDFTRLPQKFDYVFDAVGKSTYAKCKPLLKPGGIYISSELGPYGQNPFLALLTPLAGGKKVIFPVPVNISASLDFILERMEAGEFKPLIDKVYPLDEIAAAYQYVASAQKVGNVLVAFHDQD